MIEYLKSILPRVQKYSKQLDKVEVFVDKPWVFIDEKANHHEYMFLRDNRLIMSLNGSAKEGRWELMPNGKLLINRIDDSILLQNVFIDDALMFLKISGTNDTPFVLINEHKVPDLDVLRYLNSIDREVISSESSGNSIRINRDGRLVGKGLQIGTNVDGGGSQNISGTFHSDEYPSYVYFGVENCKIMSIYELVDINFYREPKPLRVKKFKIHRQIEKGDLILQMPSSIQLPGRLEYYDSDIKKKIIIDVDKSGLVIKSTDKETVVFEWVATIFFGIILLLLVYSIYDFLFGDH